MGDWLRLFQFFECPTAADANRVYGNLGRAQRQYRWLHPGRWGMHFGFIGISGRLIQTEVVTRNGFEDRLAPFVTSDTPDVHWMQVNANHNFWAQSGPPGQFDFSWNYLFVPRGARNPRLPLEEAVARCGIAAQVRRTNQGQVVCLAAPLAIPSACRQWESLYCEPEEPADPLTRLLESLCICAQELDGGSMDLFLGLRTAEYGYVQLATLTLQVDQETYWPGWANLMCNGDLNLLKDEVQAGSCAQSTYMGTTFPKIELTSDWPYDPAPELPGARSSG